MAKSEVQSLLRRIVVALGAVWMAVTIYDFFFDVDPQQFGFHAPDVENRLVSCTGGGRQYYDCVDMAIIRKGQREFLGWAREVALVLGPPLLLWVGVNLATRQRVNDAPEDFLPPPTPIKRWRVW